MIQFNLLPDVKLEFVRAQQMKRLVMGTVMIATASSLVVFLLLFAVVHGVQRKSMSDLNGDISKYTNQLKQTPDLDKVLTIQNQLSALTSLHDQKVVAGREFGFMQQLTPSDVTISDLSTDFTAHTMNIAGNAPSLDAINTFTDSLKFATYSGPGDSGKNAFSNVVLSQFGHQDTSTSYTITLSFDPPLFSNDSNKTLTVPKEVTTRSIIEQPTAIFKSSNKSSSNQ